MNYLVKFNFYFLSSIILIVIFSLNNLSLVNSISINLNTTNNSNEVNYELINQANNTEFNSTVTELPSSKIDREHSNSFKAKFINYIRNIDRYTLILISAFLTGLLLISCLICLALCICKGINNNKRDKLTVELTNPAYDEKNAAISMSSPFSLINSNYLPVSQNMDEDEKDGTLTRNNNQRKPTLCDGESDFEVEPLSKENMGSNETLTNKKNRNSSSSSSLSFGRVSITPKTPPQFKKQHSDHLEQDSTDHTPLFEKNSNLKRSQKNLFQNESQTKYKNNEKTSSSLSLVKLKELTGSRSKSILGSTTSVVQPQVPLNFAIIEAEIDHMAVNKSLVKLNKNSDEGSSSSNLNKNNNNNNNVSEKTGETNDDDLQKQKSISDIYIEYIKSKRQETQSASKQKKSKQLINEGNKRHSVNVSFNPNGGVNGSSSKLNQTTSPSNNLVNASNLLSNDSMSIDTLGSEKSCY